MTDAPTYLRKQSVSTFPEPQMEGNKLGSFKSGATPYTYHMIISRGGMMELGPSDDSAATIFLPAARSSAAPATSSKVRFLRRYVTDIAAGTLVNESIARDRHELQDGGLKRRKRRPRGSMKDSEATLEEEKTRLRNAPGVRLLHDALGEAEVLPAYLAARPRRARDLPSSGEGDREAVAAAFEALQCGRVLRHRAHGIAYAYTLEKKADGRVDSDLRDFQKDADCFSDGDETVGNVHSGDEAVIVVDHAGQNINLNEAQQRQVRNLLQAEEQPVQVKPSAVQLPMSSEAAIPTTGVGTLQKRTPGLPAAVSPRAAVDYHTYQDILSTENFSRPVGEKEEHSFSSPEMLKYAMSDDKHIGAKTHSGADSGERLLKCDRAQLPLCQGRRNSDIELRLFRTGGEVVCCRVRSPVHRPSGWMRTAKNDDLSPRRNRDERLRPGDLIERDFRIKTLSRSSSSSPAHKHTRAPPFSNRDHYKARFPPSGQPDYTSDLSPPRRKRSSPDDAGDRMQTQRASAFTLERTRVSAGGASTIVAEACKNKAPGMESGALIKPAKKCGQPTPDASASGRLRRMCLRAERNAAESSGKEDVSGSDCRRRGDERVEWLETACEEGRRSPARSRWKHIGQPTAADCSGARENGGSRLVGADLAASKKAEPSRGCWPRHQVVYRDLDGHIITEKEWLELRDPRARRKRCEKKNRDRRPLFELAWGKGLVQQEEKAETAAEEALLAQQPLARYALEADFDLELQKKSRWDDPLARVPVDDRSPQIVASGTGVAKAAAQLQNSKQTSEPPMAAAKISASPRCPFDAPKNRFGIYPGYRWDGVIRGNGYEDRKLEAIARGKHEKQMRYKNNVADM